MAVETFDLITLFDLKYELHDVMNFHTVRNPKRLVTRAMMSALRDIPRLHEWMYYRRRMKINTVVPFGEGTTTSYDAATNTVTLTGGVWPTWAKWGVLFRANRQYEIERILTTTTATLNPKMAPSESWTDSDYSLVQQIYPLPPTLERITDLIDLKTSFSIEVTNSQHLLPHMAGNQGPKRPLLACVRGDQRWVGGLVLEFAPPPNAEREYDVVWDATPAYARIIEHQTDVTITEGTFTVTGTGFTDQMTGALLRVSANTTEIPTGVEGIVASNADGEVVNPFDWQTMILSVDSDTTITVADPAPKDYTANKGIVSDLCDIEVGAMSECFYRLAEWKLSILGNLKDKEIVLREGTFRKALQTAMAADSRYITWNTQMWSTRGWTLADWDAGYSRQ